MNENPRVSVIIPVYKVENYLRECLDSIAAQSFADFEVVAVDDGSPDSSGRILDEFAARDPRFRVIHQENAGAGAARNRGLEIARGDYLLFCDADDTCLPSLLERTVQTLDETRADVVVFAYNRLNAETGKRKCRKVLALESGPASGLSLSEDLFQRMNSVPWNKVFRRAHVLGHQIRFQSLPRGNDIYFVYSALAEADRIAVIEEPLYEHLTRRSDGLHLGFDRHPFTFYEAKDAVASRLKAEGRFEPFRHSLIRSVYMEAVRLLDKYEDKNVLVEAYDRLRKRLTCDPDYSDLTSILSGQESELSRYRRVMACPTLGRYRLRSRLAGIFRRLLAS